METKLTLKYDNAIELTIKNGKNEVHAVIWEENNKIIFDSELSELNEPLTSFNQLLNNIRTLQEFVK